jgi:hypothetical protein
MNDCWLHHSQRLEGERERHTRLRRLRRDRGRLPFFVRTRTSDLKDRHIRSNVNSSGPTGTRLFDRQTEDAVTLLVSAVPMGCMGGAMKSPTQRCFKFQMTAVLSQLPNCSLIATEEQSDRGPLLCLAT